MPKVLLKLKDEQGVKVQARVFKAWSHIVCLLYCHFASCVSLNDICDALWLHRAVLNIIRNTVAPCRNTLSNANRKRDSRNPHTCQPMRHKPLFARVREDYGRMIWDSTCAHTGDMRSNSQISDFPRPHPAAMRVSAPLPERYGTAVNWE